jgi:hypothetical protein
MEKIKITPKKIEEIVIRAAIEIAKTGEGALFVIGDKVEYEKLIKQRFEHVNVFENGAYKILKGLAVIDGAVVIDKRGNLVDYGVLIKKTKAFIGYGTRHAAALTASQRGNTAILVSEEERKVKIFKDGRYLMQIDALEKNVEKKVPMISGILESVGAGLLGTIGTAAIAPTLGVALIPGIILFGGSYYAIKAFMEKHSK